MSADYVRRYYGVPAKRGGRIRYTGRGKPVDGTIVGFRDQYLRVRLDDSTMVASVHPTWCVEYLDGAA